MSLAGWPVGTVLRGRIVYRDHAPVAPAEGEPLRSAVDRSPHEAVTRLISASNRGGLWDVGVRLPPALRPAHGDAFAAFGEVGLGDESAVRATGRRFRDTILALGGSRPPMEVFRAFRGRAPTTDALLRHSGLRA